MFVYMNESKFSVCGTCDSPAGCGPYLRRSPGTCFALRWASQLSPQGWRYCHVTTLETPRDLFPWKHTHRCTQSPLTGNNRKHENIHIPLSDTHSISHTHTDTHIFSSIQVSVFQCHVLCKLSQVVRGWSQSISVTCPLYFFLVIVYQNINRHFSGCKEVIRNKSWPIQQCWIC